MRLWLRSRHGIRTGYPKKEIDLGMEDLGFNSTDDALIAYTLFGGDLTPGMLDSLELSVSADDIAAIPGAHFLPVDEQGNVYSVRTHLADRLF